MQVFSKSWFIHHQKTLLWLANNWLTRVWFRWVLRIRLSDCPIRTKINLILPNSFTYNVKRKGDDLEATTDFRVNDKFARRLYFAFRPLWYVLHFSDWAFLDGLNLGFGFATLTQYPGSIGADNPCDGHLRRNAVDETFATIRAGAGTYNTNSSILFFVTSSTTTNQFAQIGRGIMCFDTSALTADATISATTLSLYGSSIVNNSGGTPTTDIVASTPASTSALANSDYGQLGSTSFSNIAFSSLSDSAYNNYSLNASGISNVSKTGISKFGGRHGWDYSGTFGGTWSSNAASMALFLSASATGTSQDPKLVVTYTVPATTPVFALLLGAG